MEEGISFGQWLKRRRKACDLTQAALAHEVACAVQTIRALEADRLRPSREMATRLARTFDISAGDQAAFVAFARGATDLPATALPHVLPGLPAHVRRAQTPDRLPSGDTLPPDASSPGQAHDLQPEVRDRDGRTPGRHSRGANLPVQLTPFVGREQEVETVRAYLRDPAVRLLTLTGPGGIGKTRLALKAAAAEAGMFADGVWFVPLAGLTSADFLATAIAGAIQFSFVGSEGPTGQLIDHLRTKALLLVLDNFEHLLGGTPDLEATPRDIPVDLLVAILQQTSRITLLVTSRERLHLQGEWVVDLQGLEVPDAGQTEGIEGYSGVQLFLQSARRIQGGFALTGDEQVGVTEICQLVEGHPLAIELAAAWVRVLSCGDIARELRRGIDVLTSSLWDVPARHRSLRAVFDHSWKLLSEDERRALRALSVFRGDAGREAAQQVAGARLPVLSALIDKSLLRRSLQAPESARYELHELVRQYAHEQLEEAGEVAQARARHLTYFLRFAEEAESQLRGEEQGAWLLRLEMEYDNLRAALLWSRAGAAADVESGLRLAGALAGFWEVRGLWTEGRALLATLLRQAKLSTTRHTAAQAKVLHGAAALAFYQGDDAAARTYYEQSLAIYRELEDRHGIAWALIYLGWMANDRGDFATARPLLQESLAICRVLDDQQGIAWSLARLGLVEMYADNAAAAHPLLEESLALCRRLGDRWGTAWALLVLGVAVHAQGEVTAARDCEEESVTIWRELGEARNLGYSLTALGFFALGREDLAAAEAFFQEALMIAVELGDKWGMSLELSGFVALSAMRGQPERAIRLERVVAGLRDPMGAAFPPLIATTVQTTLGLARQALDTEAQAAARAEGQAMPLEQAIAYALERAD